MKPLNDIDTEKLRSKNLISNDEIAFLMPESDSILVENVITHMRRVFVIDNNDVQLVTRKTLLKG